MTVPPAASIEGTAAMVAWMSRRDVAEDAAEQQQVDREYILECRPVAGIALPDLNTGKS